MKPPADDGYGVATGYTYGYYRRLSPTWLRLIAAAHGVSFPQGEPFRYFELGFGQGVSLNVHAAANPGEFWGNDYNPEHVAFARSMAKASGADLHLLPDSFEELAQRSDLPQFQVVVAHGIWSWISESTRAAILKFLDERLAPGGLLYVSYNALPGSVSGIAAQRYLHAASRSLDPSLSESERFELARVRLRSIKDEPGGHFDRYPQAKQRLEKILGGTSAYYLHEYTVGTWQPMLLLEVAAQLKAIGLDFCGSAHLSASDLGQTSETRGAGDVLLDETLRDFTSDRMFRPDVFVRSDSRRAKRTGSRLGDQEIALTALPDEIDLTSPDAQGHAIRERLGHLVNTLESCPSSRSSLRDLLQQRTPAEEENTAAATFALNAGLLHPVKCGFDEGSFLHARNLNNFLAANPIKDGNRQLRVSPVIGAAIEFPVAALGVPGENASIDEIVSGLVAMQQTDCAKKLSATEVLNYAVNYRSRLQLAASLRINWA